MTVFLAGYYEQASIKYGKRQKELHVINEKSSLGMQQLKMTDYRGFDSCLEKMDEAGFLCEDELSILLDSLRYHFYNQYYLAQKLTMKYGELDAFYLLKDVYMVGYADARIPTEVSEEKQESAFVVNSYMLETACESINPKQNSRLHHALREIQIVGYNDAFVENWRRQQINEILQLPKLERN